MTDISNPRVTRRTILKGTAAAAVGAAAAYAFTYYSVSELLDGQLQQIALNVGGGLSVADMSPAADDDPEDVFAIAIVLGAGQTRLELAHLLLPRLPPLQLRTTLHHVC